VNEGTEVLPRHRADVDHMGEAAAGLGDCLLIVVDPVSGLVTGAVGLKNVELSYSTIAQFPKQIRPSPLQA